MAMAPPPSWAILRTVVRVSEDADLPDGADVSHDTLHCFSSQTGAWVTKAVRNPLPRWIWTFRDVDTAAGLLACDPFADVPDMAYVPLPRDGDDDDDDAASRCYCSERMIASRRFVQLSNHSFRCVYITPARHGAAPTVTMRTLANPETADWTRDYQVSFADIWADDTYKAAGLPDKEPVVALIHPINPDVLYCFLDDYLFGVDVRARKVVQCEAHGMPQDSVSSSSVLACKLPPARTAAAAAAVAAPGFGGDDTVNASNDESTTAAST